LHFWLLQKEEGEGCFQVHIIPLPNIPLAFPSPALGGAASAFGIPGIPDLPHLGLFWKGLAR
jgi:hypothetical protein